jgi:cytochrome c biogenesis protein CcmG/thiol:disulfide interchange protein DsbE
VQSAQISRARLVVAAVGLALVLLLGSLAVAMTRGVGTKPDGRSSAGGRVMPAFSLARFDGASFDLQEHGRAPVFVYFWASWCVPCQAEAPVIQKVWPEYQKRGYTFVGVNIWDAESDAKRFLEQQRLTFPVVADTNGRVYVDYGVDALPDSYFLEPGLRARTRYQGALTEATLRELLDELARPGGAS